MLLCRFTTASLAIIVASLAILAGAPMLRDSIRDAVQPEVAPIDYFASAQRQPESPDGWLAVLTVLRAALLALGALLCLTTVGLTVSASVQSQTFAQADCAIIYEGELAYHGL